MVDLTIVEMKGFWMETQIRYGAISVYMFVLVWKSKHAVMSIHQKAKMVINMPICLSEFQEAPDGHSSVSKPAPSDSHKLTDQENENGVM